MLTGANSNQQEDNSLDSNLDYQLDEYNEEEQVFDLPIDVYFDDENIYVRAFIPGVDLNDIDISISRDTVEIVGERIERKKIEKENFHQKELIWGKFMKKVSLPNEIDVDRVKSNTKNGTIILKLPKLDKDRLVKVSLT